MATAPVPEGGQASVQSHSPHPCRQGRSQEQPLTGRVTSATPASAALTCAPPTPPTRNGIAAHPSDGRAPPTRSSSSLQSFHSQVPGKGTEWGKGGGRGRPSREAVIPRVPRKGQRALCGTGRDGTGGDSSLKLHWVLIVLYSTEQCPNPVEYQPLMLGVSSGCGRLQGAWQ